MSSPARPSASLENALSWAMGAVLFLVLLVLLGIAAWIGREAAIQFALSRLHHDAEAIIAGMDVESGRIVRDLPPIFHQPLSGHYYSVVFTDGRRLASRSLWDQELVLPKTAPTAARYWLTDGPLDQTLLVWQSPYEKDGQAFSIAIGEDIAPLLSAIERFVAIGMIASLAAMLLILLAQRLAIRRAFAPLDSLREEVRAVRDGQRELLGEQVPSEVLPLVTEFNQLLRTWKAHQQRSRDALGNLAHALKAPLSLIARHGEKHQEQLLITQAGRLRELIERELKRARITGRAAIGQHFRPRQDLDDLIDTIQTLHHGKALSIQAEIDAPESLPLDRDDMLELLGNLLDNAAKWANRQVRLRLQAGERLDIEVEDDGPGINPDQIEALMQRGRRLDENRPGHGLGLAIVNDIVQLHQGRIRIEHSKRLGGACFSLSLALK